MKTTVKDRFSNVIAWLGFVIITTALGCFVFVIVQFAWHLVSPIPDYHADHQESWSYFSRIGVSSIEEVKAKMASLEEAIPTKERELSKLESNRKEATSAEDTLTADEERRMYLSLSIAVDRDALHKLSLYTDDDVRGIVEYGKSRWRENLAHQSADMAYMISYFLPLWVLIVLVNYVMMGSFRLLPWREFED